MPVPTHVRIRVKQHFGDEDIPKIDTKMSAPLDQGDLRQLIERYTGIAPMQQQLHLVGIDTDWKIGQEGLLATGFIKALNEECWIRLTHCATPDCTARHAALIFFFVPFVRNVTLCWACLPSLAKLTRLA